MRGERKVGAKFKPKEMIAAIANSVTVTLAVSRGISPDSAAMMGSISEGLVKGFDLEPSQKKVSEELNDTVTRTLSEVLSSGKYTLPYDCEERLKKEVFSAKAAFQYIHSNDPVGLLEGIIRNICAESEDCDIETLPVNELALDIIEAANKAILDNSILRELSIYSNTEEMKSKIYEMLEILHENARSSESRSSYILTPNAPRWENSQVLGRDELVADICNQLNAENGQAFPHVQMIGMGGIGKSEILNMVYIQFADNKLRHSFDHIALIKYSDTMDATIENSISYPGERNADGAWIYLQRLCQDKRVLLLIDDIRPEQGEDWRQHRADESFAKLKSLRAAILFSSRVAARNFENIDVPFLSADVCVDIFQTQRYESADQECWLPLTEEDRETLSEIIETRAGRNTLIVNRLGAITREFGYSIDSLKQVLEDKQFDLRKGFEDEELLQQEINKLYDFQTVTDEKQRSLLEAFAIFPAIPMEQATCIKWLSEDAKVVADECEMLINGLARQTWLVKQNEDDGKTAFFMHQMVSSAITVEYAVNIRAHTNLIERCTESITIRMAGTFRDVQPYIAFAVSLARYWSADEESTELAALMEHTGYYNMNIAAYESTLAWLHKALAIREKVLGKEHPFTASSYNNIAGVYSRQGDYAKALEWYEKALAIREKVLGKEHPDTASSYNNIAGVYSRQGDYAKAQDWYEKALAINEKVLVKEHPDTATTYNNIAFVYSRQGDYDKALEWYEKALAIREKVLGKEHPDTATVYNNIAGVYSCQGDYAKALEWYEKALAISEKVLGEEHPDTATTYNNMAGVYDRQGDYAKALEWYEKALAINEKVLGKEHPDTATTYNNIALVYFSQGYYTTALEWYEKALAIFEKVLGKEHPDTATAYNNIADVYFRQGDYAKALEWYKKALAIREKAQIGRAHV